MKRKIHRNRRRRRRRRSGSEVDGMEEMDGMYEVVRRKRNRSKVVGTKDLGGMERKRPEKIFFRRSKLNETEKVGGLEEGTRKKKETR